MMNEVLQTVLDYVQTPQTDYALLITGKWGCGKTYFWKNVVEPKLGQVTCNGAPCHPLYASLYGCESTKDIDTQLFLASHPHLKEKWTTRLSTVGGHALKQLVKAFTRFELPAIDLRWLVNTKHAVLCFDDLERTRLPMKEALGYINSFVEHEGAKTVILCNEDEISNKAKRKTYDAMKEKVVGASLTFRPHLDAVFQTLIDEHKARAAFHGFISQNAELLRHLFDRSEKHNIRSLRRAIAALAAIFDALKSNNITPNAIAKQLIYAVAPTSFELHGRGVDPAGLRKIHSSEYMAVAGMSSSILRSNKTDEETDEEGFAKRYLDRFGLAEWQDAVGCPPICEFLLTGFLDRNALLSWARELTKPPDEKEERINRLMSHPEDMEDEEFAQKAAQVLSEVGAGEIAPLGRYVNLYNTFEWFAKAGLITMTPQDVLTKFNEGLRKSKEARRLEGDPRLAEAFDHPSLAPKTDESRSLLRQVLAVNDELLKGTFRERAKAFAFRLKEDPQTAIDALATRDDSGLLYTPVFQELDGADIAESIITLPNSLKRRFGWAMQARHINNRPPAEFFVELPVLTEIHAALRKRCEAAQEDTTSVPMSFLLVKKIAEVLEEAIKRLQNLEQQERASRSAPTEDPTKKDKGENDDASTENADLA